MKKTISLLLILAMIVSIIQLPIQATETSEKISNNCDYSYSYSKADMVSGDIQLKNLTDGIFPSTSPGGEGWTKITLKNDSVSATVGGSAVTLSIYDDVSPHFYVKLDLDFKQKIHYIAMDFANSGSFSLPSKVEVFLSDDGYNFDIYKSQNYEVITDGNRTKYKVTFNEEIRAKAVKFVAYNTVGAVMAVDELEVYGEKLNNSVLLSNGASYTWTGNSLGGVYDGQAPSTQLTDGILSDMPSSIYSTFDQRFIMKATGGRVDSSTGYVGQEIVLDLGSVKNISKVKVNSLYNSGGYNATDLDFAVYKYSYDGINYYDFGTCYESGAGFYENQSGCARKVYTVSKNYTVEARYVKAYLYCYGHIAIDEIQVYGSQTPVAKETFVKSDREDRIEYTNIISYKGMYKDNVNQDKMTDQLYVNYSTYTDSTVVLTGTFGSKYNEICGYNIYFKTKPKSIRFYLSNDNVNWTLISDSAEYYSLAGYTNAKAYFNNKEGTYYKFEIDRDFSNNISISEIQIYNKQPHIPVIGGGFLALYPNESEGYNVNIFAPNIEKNTEYDWEMQLKGLYNQGMRTIIFQHNVDYNTKKSVMPIPVNSTLYNKGYRQRGRMLTNDPIETILTIADSLGMKVYLGTIGTYSYQNIQSNTGTSPAVHFQNVGQDGRAVITQMEASYGNHNSFAGYYFTDEACDEWIATSSGLSAFRTLYTIQSNEVRSVAPDKKIVISPAIWRTGKADTNAVNLYNLIKADSTMTKPVVDIVAAQDCLGRENSLVVTDSVYNSYENHVQWWAAKTRQAGAEFWHDAEMFETTYKPKRYSEIVNSLEMQAKTSNKITVYNLERIIPALSGNENDFTSFLIEANRMQYAKRYVSYIDALNIGTVPGCYPEQYGINPRFDTSSFVKTDIAPLTTGQIINNQWNRFTSFDLMGENENTSYALMWDDTYIYIGVKTNDKTFPSHPDGEWFGNASDYLLVMLGKPGSSGDAGTGTNTLKIGVSKHTSKVEAQVTKGEGFNELAQGDIIANFDDTNSFGRTAIVAIKWSYLGLTPSSGTVLPISIVYQQDGGTWQSLNGYKGPVIADFDTFTTAAMPQNIPRYNTDSFIKADVAPLTNGQIINSQWNRFTSFDLMGENENTSYALMWDDTYIYIGVKTNDKTFPSHPDGEWFGNASDYLLVMLGKPGSSGDAGTDANTLKIGVSKHASKVEAQVTKGEGFNELAQGDIIANFDDTNLNGRTAIVAIKWSYLGLSPEEGTVLPISIVYQQDDGAWQALNGYKGPVIENFEKFTTNY